MHRSLSLLVVLLLCVVLSACSRAPDAADAQRALEAELEDANLTPLLAVEEVEKRNGYAENERFYVLEITYRLRAKQDLDDFADQVKGGEERPALERFAMIMALAGLRMEYGDFKQNDTFHHERTLKFRDTEEGWRAVKED